MIVAISGATGYIGRHLVARHLAAGDQVRVLSRGDCAGMAGVAVFNCDLSDDSPVPPGFVEGAEVLYHCAAELSDPSRMESVNVGGTAKLIKAAAGRIGRWIQLSSVGAYGPVRAGVVVEESPEHPVGPYERTKTQADHLVLAAASGSAFGCTVLRPSTVFGNDMPNQSLVQWVGVIQRGQFFFIGRPGAMVNYVHVDSVVDALLLCGSAEVAKGRLYIVSEEMEIECFVGLICKMTGRSVPRFRIPVGLARIASSVGGFFWGGFPLTLSRVDALTNRAVYSSGRISAELAYVPSVPLAEGLEKFVENLRGSHGC